MQAGADAMPHQIMDNSITELAHVIINGRGNIVQMISFPGLFDSFKKALPCHRNQILCILTYGSYPMGSCCIRMIAFINKTCIQADNVAVLKDMAVIGNAVDHLIQKVGYAAIAAY